NDADSHARLLAPPESPTPKQNGQSQQLESQNGSAKKRNATVTRKHSKRENAVNNGHHYSSPRQRGMYSFLIFYIIFCNVTAIYVSFCFKLVIFSKTV